MSPRSWTTTISLLFQTPMIPSDSEIMENKQVEIPMVDFSPSDSSQSPVQQHRPRSSLDSTFSVASSDSVVSWTSESDDRS